MKKKTYMPLQYSDLVSGCDSCSLLESLGLSSGICCEKYRCVIARFSDDA